jgi:hypothetical protein
MARLEEFEECGEPDGASGASDLEGVSKSDQSPLSNDRARSSLTRTRSFVILLQPAPEQ